MTKRKTPAAALILLLLAAIPLSGCEKKQEQPPLPQTSEQAMPGAPPSAMAPPAPEAPMQAPQSGAMAPAEEAAGGAATPTEKTASAPAEKTGSGAMAAGEAAMRKSDCFACHSVDKKLVGPAYAWVAFRYKGDKEAASKLAASVKNGSSGKWTAYTGGAPMTPHPQLPDAEIKTMVQWILGQKPVEPPKP